MYLGELVRHILVSLVDAAPKALLFSGKSTAHLNKHYGVDTSFMSAVEEAWIGDVNEKEAFEHPAFSVLEFKKEDLSPKVVEKLEQIRRHIIEVLEFKAEEVSLRDAAVCSFLLVETLTVDVEIICIDRSMGLFYSGATRCSS